MTPATTPTQALRSLGRVVMVCGLAVAVTAATVGAAFFGVRTWLTLVPLAGGVLAAVAGAVSGLRDARMTGRSLRLVLECALAVVIAVCANVIALKAPFVVDVTGAKRNTLTEASVQTARALKAPAVVHALMDADDRGYTELAELVDRYHAVNDLITLHRVSPARDPEAARALTAGEAEKIVIVSEGRRQRVRFNAGAPDQEEQLTNALRTVSTGVRVRVYVLAGHGEAAVDDNGPTGLRRFGQALVDEGLEVVPLPLAAVAAVPDDAGAVIIAGAVAVPEAERTALKKYVDAGGRMLLLLEPGGDPFADLIGAVGVQANNDVVIDGSTFSGMLGGPETATGTAYAAHPVTTKLANAMTHFPRARSLSLNPGTPGDAKVIVETGAEAYGETRLVAGAAPAFDDADTPGPIALAMAVTLGTARVVVVGDASFAENAGIGLGANQDLALNAVLWLVEREGSIAVRPRGRGGNLLLLAPTSRERIAFVLLYGLPVLLLCAGLGLSALRRRR